MYKTQKAKEEKVSVGGWVWSRGVSMYVVMVTTGSTATAGKEEQRGASSCHGGT